VEEERLKKIAGLREILEERVRRMETELEGLRVLLEFVNNVLLEQSFKRVEPIKPKTVMPEHVEATPLSTKDGEVLANLYVGDGSMRIVPAEDKKFSVNTPPFMSFLHDRVLMKMQDRDREATGEGRISPDKVFSFDVKRDGDMIREITIRNVDAERKRELVSAIHWTLEKMQEKTKRQ